jgi:hypothetical protein
VVCHLLGKTQHVSVNALSNAERIMLPLAENPSGQDSGVSRLKLGAITQLFPLLKETPKDALVFGL